MHAPATTAKNKATKYMAGFEVRRSLIAKVFERASTIHMTSMSNATRQHLDGQTLRQSGESIGNPPSTLFGAATSARPARELYFRQPSAQSVHTTSRFRARSRSAALCAAFHSAFARHRQRLNLTPELFPKTRRAFVTTCQPSDKFPPLLRTASPNRRE